MRLRRGPVSSLVSFVLVAGFLSVTPLPVVVTQPAFADPAPSGDEASVPAQPLGTPVLPQPEDAGGPLAAPVFPAASDKAVGLSAVRAGSLVAATPSGSVVSVGPAGAGAVGPVQAAALRGPTKLGGPDGLPVSPSATPSSVDVRVLDRTQAAAVGGQGLGVVVNRTDKSSAGGAVRLSIDASRFASAYGADYFGRLAMVELPACALTTPTVEACQTRVYVNAVSDRKTHTITGVVDVNPDPATVASPVRADGATVAPGGHVVVLTTGGSSEQGDFRATDFKPSGAWSVSVGSGAFTYSLPVTLPPPAEGKAPDLSLDYNSQSVDGLTSATNNQASPVGLGWDLNNMYIERRYRACSDDLEPSGEGDLCWYSPYSGTGSGHAGDSIYDIVLNGVSSPLVPDATTANVFHPTDDPGWHVQKLTLTSGSNGDNNGEYWQVLTPDGSIYYFGIGADAKTGSATGSVLTEPVFGNDSGEPCYSSTSLSASVCTQAYRWMLDQVVDPNEVKASYHYTQEINSYRSVLGSDMSRQYVMAAELSEVDYGWASQIAGTNYTDKVVLTYQGRCSTVVAETDPLRNGTSNTGTCPSISSTPGDYPDVPTDKICSDSTDHDASGCESPVTSLSPVYFSTKMLWSITTDTLTTTGTATKVMVYQLRHGLPNPPSGIGQFLWFDYLQREGFSGTGSNTILPVINFNGTDMDNIVGSTDLEFRRITTVDNDLGGITTITYSLPSPDACTATSLPDESDNHMDCFKQQWTPDGGTSQTGWFKKYVVTEVDQDPNVGTGTGHDGDPVQTTTYTYNTGGGAGWRFPADPAQQRIDESWTEWRGYSQVTVTHAAGTGEENAVAYWVFQGLDGDRKVIAPTGPSDYKSVPVHGSLAGPTINDTDSAWLADKVYEESHRDNAGTSHQYVIHNYGFVYDTAAYTGLPDARIVREDKTYTYSKLSTSTSDTSTWREGEAQSIYDSGQNASKLFGLPVSTEDDGQVGVSTDNTCVVLGYAFNTDLANNRWYALQDDAAHHSNTCANATSGNEDGDTQTFYDGATTLGTNVPVDGNPTEVDTYTAASAHNSTEATYDAGGRVISSTDARGHTTNMAYSPTTGWPTSGVTVTTAPPDPTGVTGSSTGLATTTVTAPSYGQALTVTDPNGSVTTAQYDTVGRLINVWKPAHPTGSASMTYTYTIPTTTSGTVPDVVNGPPKTAAAVLQTGTSYVTTYTYLDGLGQNREAQGPAADPSGNRTVVSTRYDVGGYIEGVSDPYYNASTPGSGMVNPAVADLPAYHDVVVDWAGRTTEAKIDHLGTAVPDGDTLTSYPGPDLTTVTDPDGNVTDTTFDVFGQTATIKQYTPHLSPVSITTTYGYTDKHQLASITDASSHVTSYTYDWAGHQTQAVDPDTGTTTTTYDADGDVKTTTDATGQLLTHVYDRVDRQTALWLGAALTGTELTSATYDTATLGKGKPATSTSWNSGAAYVNSVDGYDADGNPTGTTVTIPSAEGALAGSYDTTYTYNAADQPTAIAYPAVGSTGVSLPAETVTTVYSAQGLPSTLTSSLPATTYVSATVYANYGPLTSRTYGTGTLTAGRTYTYNQTTGELTGITTTVTNGGTTTAQGDTYSYDPAGNVTEIASSVDGQQQCYTYDDLNRLTDAFSTTTASPTSCAGASPNHTGGPSPYDMSYSYDQLGNVITAADAISSTTATYNYNDAAHVHAVTDVTHTGGSTSHDTYGYDLNGNQNARTVSGTASTATWDPQQHLSSMTTGANSTLFIYDAAGNRLLRKATGDTVLYLPGQELHANGGTVTPTRYYTAGGTTCAMRVGGGGTNGTLTWLAGDGQGSAQLSINPTTGAYTQQRYTPFGAQRGSQGPPAGSNRSFLGQTLDPTTGLIQDGARYYDPNLGRFLSPDPIVTPGEPQNLNAYSYAVNNPETASDPSGLLYTCTTRSSDEVCVNGNQSSDSKTSYQDPQPSGPSQSHTIAVGPLVLPDTDNNRTLAVLYEQTIESHSQYDYTTLTQQVALVAQLCEDNTDCESSSEYKQLLGIAGNLIQAAAGFGNDGPGVIAYLHAGDGVGGGEFGGNLSKDGMSDINTVDDFNENQLRIGCGGNSFTPSTRVLMADGTTKQIKDIKIGDQVQSTDPAARKTAPQQVTALHDNHDTDLTDVTVNQDGQTTLIHTTTHHPFWDATTNSWVAAGALQPGDQLLTTGGHVAVVQSTASWAGEHDMRNLTVDNFHTYYVMAGSTPVLVHNTGPGGCAITGTEIQSQFDNLSTAKQSHVRTVSNEADLRGLYDQWSQGGTDVTPSTYNGTMVRLPDGTTVGWRNASKSGGATIDLTIPGQDPLKVHIGP